MGIQRTKLIYKGVIRFASVFNGSSRVSSSPYFFYMYTMHSLLNSMASVIFSVSLPLTRTPCILRNFPSPCSCVCLLLIQ